MANRTAIPFMLAGVSCIAAINCGGGSSSPPPPAPAIASFSATPSWVTSGQSTTLNWSVTNATSLSIDGLGTVSGTSLQVAPKTDTTYTLTASSPSGTVTAQTTVAVFRTPNVWFTPIWLPWTTPPYGASDYFSLFAADAPWKNAASHVAVFKMYAAMLDNFPDASLQTMFAYLKQRHIALAIEWAPLTPGTCGSGEGFGGNGLHFAQRIQALGGTLEYVAFDEPFQHASIYSGPSACQWTAQQVAMNAAQNVAEIRSVFPDVAVGDIESVPDNDLPNGWLAAYEQWLDAWQAATGKPFAFFHFDVDWSTHWRAGAAALTRALQLRQIPVGYIYIGFTENSDAAWLAAAESHMLEFEAHQQLIPDQANFQSWFPYPTHVLPETDPTAHTYLIDWYFRSRPKLTLSLNGTTASGTMSGPNEGQVQLTLVPVTGNGQPTTYTTSGTLPAWAQSVLFGARVGIENCNDVPLPAEFYLSDFTLDAGSAGSVHMDFTNGLNGWSTGGNPQLAQVEGTQLHVQVLPGQTFGLNSFLLPLAAGGAAYTLTVHAMIPNGSRGDACVIAIYEDATRTESNRDVLLVEPLPVSLGTVTTAADGTYSLPIGTPLPSLFTLWADYAGTSVYWPAAASVKIGAPPLLITTSSLPAGSVGSSYTQSLIANGGLAPYIWVGAGVPPGLVLGADGSLSGTPTTAGTYSISVSAVDSSNPTAVSQRSVSLMIN